jgi:hypothetical protein
VGGAAAGAPRRGRRHPRGHPRPAAARRPTARRATPSASACSTASTAWRRGRTVTHEADERFEDEYRRLRLAALEAERKEILRLRDEEVVSDDLMRRVQRDLDLEQMLLESPEGPEGDETEEKENAEEGEESKGG